MCYTMPCGQLNPNSTLAVELQIHTNVCWHRSPDVPATYPEMQCIGRPSCRASTASGLSLIPVTIEPPRSAAPDRSPPCPRSGRGRAVRCSMFNYEGNRSSCTIRGVRSALSAPAHNPVFTSSLAVYTLPPGRLRPSSTMTL